MDRFVETILQKIIRQGCNLSIVQNTDGFLSRVDTQDVLGIYDYIQNQTTNEPHAREDVNRDKIVDTQDVLGVYDYMVGK